MRSILSLLLIVLSQVFLSTETKAQTVTSPACPVVRIESKADNPILASDRDIVCPGADVTFTANVDGIGPEDRPTFNWTVSGGKIISGQGTPTIVASTAESSGREITATVEVAGLDALKSECLRPVSRTIGIALCCMPCPAISISCPTDIPKLGEPVAISVNISGSGLQNINPKYNWQVSPGKIVGGQGTPVISVDINGIVGQSVVATVEIDGLPPECDRTESCSFSWQIEPPIPESSKFDEYGEVRRINEEKRLSNFVIQLQQEPGAQGYVIIYGPRRVRARLELARKFLIEKRGLEPSRLELIDGGYRKKTKVELWLRPTGAWPPMPK
jgi:hypothetical protein